jgi:hypothetical protein
MTLLGTLCGFGLLNAGPIPDGPDQHTGIRRRPTSKPLTRSPLRTLSQHSDHAEQKQSKKNDEHDADNPHSSMAVAVTVSTKAATEATQ